MIRFAALEIALFLAPFVAYAFYLAARRKTGIDAFRAEAPLVVLAIVGLLLGVAMLAGLVAFEGATGEGRYVPDRFENGRLIPGHIE
jgi:hypothetical protein